MDLEVFDQRQDNGMVVTYLVEETIPYAALLRVRRPLG